MSRRGSRSLESFLLPARCMWELNSRIRNTRISFFSCISDTRFRSSARRARRMKEAISTLWCCSSKRERGHPLSHCAIINNVISEKCGFLTKPFNLLPY